MKTLDKPLNAIKKDNWIKDYDESFNTKAIIKTFAKTDEFLTILNRRLSYNKDVLYWYANDGNDFIRFVDKNFQLTTGYSSNLAIDLLVAKCHESFKSAYQQTKLFSKAFVSALEENDFIGELSKYFTNSAGISDASQEMLASMLLWEEEKVIDEKNLVKMWNYHFQPDYYHKYDGDLGQKPELFLNKAINDIYERSQRCVENIDGKDLFRFVFVDDFSIDNIVFLEEFLHKSYIDDNLEEVQVLLMQLIMATIIDSVSENMAKIVRELWFFYGLFINANQVMNEELVDIYTTFLVRLHSKILKFSETYLKIKKLTLKELKEIAIFINSEEKAIAKDICNYIRLYLQSLKIFK